MCFSFKLLTRLSIFALCFSTMAFAKPKKADQAKPVPIIFDTDMDTDCDDAGALAILHALADKGEVEILGTVVSSHYPYSAPCVEAINRYYGRPDLPVGAPKRPGAPIDRGSRYARQIAQEFQTELQTNDDARDAVEVYREILGKQPDHSVKIVTVGYVTNVADLMESKPDKYSPMNGMELIKQKVKIWVCMGGRYPKHLNPGVFGNFKPDPASAVQAAEDWPGTIVFTGLGTEILTGSNRGQMKENNPVRRVYDLYLKKKAARPSWDLMAVLYAARPNADYWDLKKGGYNHIYENGTNAWKQGDVTHHRLLKLKSGTRKKVNRLLDDLMVFSREK